MTLEDAVERHYAPEHEATSADVVATWGFTFDQAQEELEEYRLSDPAGFERLGSDLIGQHGYYMTASRRAAAAFAFDHGMEALLDRRAGGETIEGALNGRLDVYLDGRRMAAARGTLEAARAAARKDANQ